MLTWDFIQILFSVSLLSFTDLFHRLLVWFLPSSTDCWISVLTHNGKSVMPYTTTYIKIPKILACFAKTEGQKKQLSSHLHFAKSCLSDLYVPLTQITHKAPGSTLLREHQPLSLVHYSAVYRKSSQCSVSWMDMGTVCVCLWLPGLQK